MTEPKMNAVLLKSNGLFLSFLQKSRYNDRIEQSAGREK